MDTDDLQYRESLLRKHGKEIQKMNMSNAYDSPTAESSASIQPRLVRKPFRPPPPPPPPS